ncbi:hypothetical protein D3C79_345070 [compost metagenome]
MHLHRLGDVVEYHGLHGLFTVLEETLLLLDYAACHLEQGVVSTLQTLDEPLGFLQMGTNELSIRAAAGIACHCRIGLVDTNARRRIRVEFNHPLRPLLDHGNIRDHVLRFALDDAITGSGLQLLDEIQYLLEVALLEPGLARQGAVVTVAEQVHVLADHLPCLIEPRQIRRILAKLDQQTLLYRASGDANRIEMLHPLEHGFHFIQFNFYLFTADCSLNIFERNGQVARLIDGIDDGEGNRGIQITERRQSHLPQQIILQIFGGFPLIDAVFPVMDGASALSRAGGIDLIPGSVHRQFIRHLVLCHCVTGVELTGVLEFYRTGFVRLILLLLQQGVIIERLLNFLLEFQGGELEQTNRLL